MASSSNRTIREDFKDLTRTAAVAAKTYLNTQLDEFTQDDEKTLEIDAASIEDLQIDLLRFEGRFAARLRNAMEDLKSSPSTKVRLRAHALHLEYVSSALDIAVAPRVEISLVDMIVLMELSRGIIADHFIPNEFEGAGTDLLRAFEDSCSDIWEISKEYLTENQRNQLQEAILLWRQHNPQIHNITGMRFSGIMRELKDTPIGKATTGSEHTFLPRFNKALEAADEARLLAERTFFYAQRLPFLIRAHVKMTVFESINEVGNFLKDPAVKRRAIMGLGAMTVPFISYFASKTIFRYIDLRMIPNATPRSRLPFRP